MNETVAIWVASGDEFRREAEMTTLPAQENDQQGSRPHGTVRLAAAAAVLTLTLAGVATWNNANNVADDVANTSGALFQSSFEAGELFQSSFEAGEPAAWSQIDNGPARQDLNESPEDQGDRSAGLG